MTTPLTPRRKFLTDAALTAAALAVTPHVFAQSAATLNIQTSASGTAISPDFIGLSYENMQLEDPTFFSTANHGLIEQFRAISPRGVLRLGGNTSEFNWWQSDPSQPAPKRDLVLKNGDKPQTTLYAITPETIRNLDGFLKATGWTCIYGLNLGFGTPETDLPEARFVFNTLGPRLQYFQIGNEVDQFIQYHLRDGDTWNVQAYLKQWLVIAHAVQKAIPAAKFGLPDVASKVEWLTDIAAAWPSVTDAPNVTTLSHHYYWSGPPSNPAATIQKLLQADPQGRRKGGTLPRSIPEDARRLPHDRGQHRLSWRQIRPERCLRRRPLGRRLSAHAHALRLFRSESSRRQRPRPGSLRRRHLRR